MSTSDVEASGTDVPLGDEAPVIRQSFRKEVIKQKSGNVKEMLDKCYHFEDDDTIVFDYKHFKDPEDNPSKAEGCAHLIQLLKNNRKSDLIMHPVVASLLSWKWRHYVAYFYIVNLFFFLVFLLFLNGFALALPNPQHTFCDANISNLTNLTEAATMPTCGDLSGGEQSFVAFAAVVLILLSCFRILMELLRVFNIKKIIQCCSDEKSNDDEDCCDIDYFKHPSNYLSIPLNIMTIIFASAVSNHCYCASNFQWQIGISTVVLAWVDLVFYFTQWPLLGVYIEMLWKITFRFFNALLVILIFLLFGFAVAFYMAFYEPHLEDSPFKNPLFSLMTIVSFAINGPDIGILRLSGCAEETAIPYPALAHILWIVLGIVISILFLTLIVGLAVDDVSKVLEQIEKRRFMLMADTFKTTEEIIGYFNFITKCICKKKFWPTLMRKRSPKENKLKLSSWYVRMAFLWGDEIRTIVEKAREEKLGTED